MPRQRTAEEYIADLIASLKANANVRLFYFPPGRKRKEMCLRLGREVGYGLTMPDAEQVIGTLYGRLVVQFCLDRFGVALDARGFVKAVQEGRAKAGAGNKAQFGP